MEKMMSEYIESALVAVIAVVVVSALLITLL